MDQKALFDKFVTFTASVHRVTHELTKNAKPDILTNVQYNILEYIAVSQPVTISQISDCQHMSLPNTSRELKKLSEKDLIKKTEDTEDRRKQYILLSKNGEILMSETFEYIKSHFQHRIHEASMEDLKDMEQAMDILHKKLFY